MARGLLPSPLIADPRLAVATRYQPHISVSAARDGAFWQFSVTDNGIGVPPEYAERIFVIFQRLQDRQAYAPALA